MNLEPFRPVPQIHQWALVLKSKPLKCVLGKSLSNWSWACKTHDLTPIFGNFICNSSKLAPTTIGVKFGQCQYRGKQWFLRFGFYRWVNIVSYITNEYQAKSKPLSWTTNIHHKDPSTVGITKRAIRTTQWWGPTEHNAHCVWSYQSRNMYAFWTNA